MIVAAALVDNCCERIEDAREAKLLSRRLLLELGNGSITPIVQIPERSMTVANLGLIFTIALAMTADSRVVIPPAGLMERTLAAVNALRRKRALVIFSFAVYF
jgi:hypothetical protein